MSDDEFAALRVGDPRELSGRELDDLLDEYGRRGLDDSKEFHRAYRVWERSQ